MATIPQIVTSPGSVPSTGGSQVRVSPQVDIKAPADPFQALQAGASLEQQALQTTQRSGERLADAGAAFADKYIKAKLNVDAADHQAALSKQLHEAEFESSKISDRQLATADFDARAAKIRDDFAAQDVNSTVRAAVDASLPNQILLRRAATQNAAFGLESKQQVGKLIGQIDQYNKQAVDAQDPRLTETLIAQANAAIDGRVEGGWLGADVAAKMKVDFESNVYRTKIELAMSKDMRAGLALFDATKGKLNAADSRAMGNMAADRAKQVDAEATVTANMPRTAGGGGDIGAVRADAEKAIGIPLTITSADRSEAHNKAVGGAAGSQHLQPGKALDISLAGLTEEQKQKVYQHFLNDSRVGGIGFYADHLHIDARGGQRTTWGTPPPAMSEQIQAWQGSAPAPASGDQHAQTRIRQFEYRQSIVDNLAIDPEVKARQLAIIDRNMGQTNAIVMEQRKSAADAAEKAGIDLTTGKYRAGTFQGIADQFTATGDSSSAATMQVLADNEAQLIEDAKNPPAQRSPASMLLPGAGGRIAAQQSAEKRAEITEARQLAAQNRAANLKAAAEQEKIFNDGVNAGGDPKAFERNMDDAIAYAIAANDLPKARALHEQYVGAQKGATESKLPPAERERKRQELEEKIKNQQDLGLPITRAQAEALKFHDKGTEANRQKWEQDPLSATHDIGRIQLQAFDINMDGTNLQMWATQRLKDAWTATYSIDGTATNLRSNFFTQSEMATITQKLDGMPPREAQQFLAKLAVALPPQAMVRIGEQMSKKDPVSDSYAAAFSLYARGKPGDIDIANSIITGMNWQSKGGPDGKTRIGDDKLAQSHIDTALSAARVNMNPDAVRLQNNAIMAHYVGLTANKPDRTSIDTTMLDKAITDVVGRTMTHNGATTIIPREIEPYQFRNGVAAITPADVASLQPTASGQPITAEVVRQNGQLMPTGDGKYQVRIPDPRRPGITVQLIDANTRRPWEVDINPLIARGVRGAGAANQPDPVRQGQVPTPTPQPLIPPRPRP